eukprot:COSAG01_NODE_37667_length_500_cov_1.167082_1_plen_71_part_01
MNGNAIPGGTVLQRGYGPTPGKWGSWMCHGCSRGSAIPGNLPNCKPIHPNVDPVDVSSFQPVSASSSCLGT